MDAYPYIRFSTPRQENGSSRERQLEDARAFIARMGWNEMPSVEDLGRSAWKGDHLRKGNLGKLAKRLFDQELPRSTVIVVEEIDRLSRQKARTTLRWMSDVCDLGYQIATVRGERVYNAENLDANILQIMEILLKAEANHDYSEKLSHRVKRSYESRLKDARENGTAITTQGPAWLEAVGKRPNVTWRPIPERTKLVREIFELTATGKPPWDIASVFNTRGEKSFTGKAWERTAIVKIIRSPAIQGDYAVGEGKNSRPTGEVLYGYYGDPVIPADLVAQARAMLDRRQIRKGKGRNSGAVNNLFGQKIRCARCGGRMMTMGDKSSYLACYEASRHNGCDQRSTFHYKRFEAAALDAILHLALDEAYFRQAAKSNHLNVEIEETRKAVRDRQAEAGRLVDMLSRIGSPTTERKLVELEMTIGKLENNLLRLTSQLAAAEGAATNDAHLARIHGVREALTHPEDEVRLPARLRVAEALHSLVDHVLCDLDPQTGERWFRLLIATPGLHAIWLDNQGNKTGEILMGLDQDLTEITDDPAQLAKLEGYLRRRRAAAAAA